VRLARTECLANFTDLGSRSEVEGRSDLNFRLSYRCNNSFTANSVSNKRFRQENPNSRLFTSNLTQGYPAITNLFNGLKKLFAEHAIERQALHVIESGHNFLASRTVNLQGTLNKVLLSAVETFHIFGQVICIHVC